jgi:superfamily II DNA or RNA helicase
MISVEDFLPLYPNINYNNYLINPYNNLSLNQVIYKKAEFNELKLGKIVRKVDIYLDSQNIIKRFMSPYTMFKGVLLFQEMGVGKTGAAISVGENLIDSNDSNINKIIVIAKNSDLLNNWKQEIIYKYGSHKYQKQIENIIDETGDNNISNHNISKVLSKYRFVKPSEIKQLGIVTNALIIVDEVHNYRYETKGTKDEKNYSLIKKLVKQSSSNRVILLTGTPMVDKIIEFIDIINLLLPEEIDRKDFIDKYAYEQENAYGVSQIYLTESTRLLNKLKEKFMGFISYIKAPVHTIGKINMVNSDNEISDNVSSFGYGVMMKGVQSNVYESNAVGYDDNVIINKMGKLQQILSYVDKNSEYGHQLYSNKKLKKNILTSDMNELRDYSCKFHEILNISLDTYSNESGFIFSEIIMGGLDVMKAILRKFGYIEAKGTSIYNEPPKKRFIYLTGEKVQTTKKLFRGRVRGGKNKIERLINLFNDPRNVKGEYVQLILGSRKVSEGYTFKNIQNVHIITPWHNYSVIDQAISRCYRYGSHDDLIKLYPDAKPVLKIYKYIAIPENGNYEISDDYIRYQRSYIKDQGIKQLERVIKESAFDCQLTKERNLREGFDYERDCDYQECEYDCYKVHHDDDELIIDTYNLYYGDNDIREIKELNKSILQQSFVNNIRENITEYDSFLIDKSIKDYDLIDNNLGITGVSNYDGEYTFLSQNTNNNIFDMYYTINPSISDKYISDQIVNISKIIKGINELILTRSPNYAKYFMDVLPTHIHDLILQYTLCAKFTYNIDNKFVKFMLNKYFKGKWEQYGETYRIKHNNTCMNSNTTSCDDDWIECKEDEREVVEEPDNLDELPIYGRIIDGKFKIFLKADKKIKKGGEGEDKRAKSRGKVCDYYKKSQLIDIIKLVDAETDYTKANKKTLCKSLENTMKEQNLLF